MRWRKFRLDWTYAIGELVIVTLGVLIALAIGEWNDERVVRAEEFNVLSRINTPRFRRQLSIAEKELKRQGRELPAPGLLELV